MRPLSEDRYMVKIEMPTFGDSIGDVILEGIYSGFNLKNWPAIYRKMDWWEYRRPEEMPFIVKKTTENDGYHLKNDVFMVSRWVYGHSDLVATKHPSGCKWVAIISGSHAYNAACLVPITKDEYDKTPKDNKPSVGN